MFTFGLKATMCAWPLSNGTNSQQERPETEKKEENLQTYDVAQAVFGGFTVKVSSFMNYVGHQSVRNISVPQTSQIQGSQTPSDRLPIPACGSGIVKPWNDPFYLDSRLKFKHLQPGQGPRDDLNHSKTKLRPQTIWWRHSLWGVSSANKKPQYLEEKLSRSWRTAGKLEKRQRRQAWKHIVTH